MRLAIAVQTLCDAGVEFVVVGGVSAVLHGSATLTFDLDICYERSRRNLHRLAECLAPFHPRPRGFPPNLPFVWDVAALNNSTVLTLDTDLGPIDLLAEVAGIGAYAQVAAQSVSVSAFDRCFATLGLPGLIRAKRAAGREKDLRSLPELESLLDAGDA